MNREETKTIRTLLDFIYGGEAAEPLHSALMEILSEGPGGKGAGGFDHRDALLISYGDMLSGPGGPESEASDGRTGLSRLGAFLDQRNRGAFTYLHILPFHPYSSDDGFSVIDYRAVDDRFGTWGDIEALGEKFRLVFDFVVNHGSVQSRWFKGFLAQDEKYARWYITRPADYDYSGVVRPRTHPLLTPFTMKDGSVSHVWTTFSADQVDYDFSDPEVLLEFIRIFLDYVRRGGRIVRLDAIAYLWKEDGTPCIHHPKTHAVVKLFRAIIDYLELDMLILTETNVPHAENISYFGDGDEAHMVYNFALPPLVLHAAVSGDAGPLRKWAKTLPDPKNAQLFLNFLASHDGVGLTPAKGLVADDAFAGTIEESKNRGALVSYKAAPGGSVPYELNCSYASVVAPRSMGGPDIRARAFLATQGVLLSLPGLPAVYFHSWVGSEAWQEGPELLGYNRAINREKPPAEQVERELEDSGSFRSRVYRGFSGFLEFRKREPAFGPREGITVLDTEGSLFAVVRGPDAAGRRVLCAMNLGPAPVSFAAPDGFSAEPATLEPWETRWMARGGGDEPREFSTAR
ncbi:sugar phosphorylase [Breznakiella homolactica]|uniref:Sugar phosphorylase n=1 Tax=Breznakiella homolactica TaxID=2798577 RepID=A0A7T8B9J6_9SPIR|nr:sugar phosphorylase [Breznakiella homolactica]QQO08030.1 sugar phosphorylase [Breznakiella homolactica]